MLMFKELEKLGTYRYAVSYPDGSMEVERHEISLEDSGTALFIALIEYNDKREISHDILDHTPAHALMEAYQSLGIISEDWDNTTVFEYMGEDFVYLFSRGVARTIGGGDEDMINLAPLNAVCLEDTMPYNEEKDKDTLVKILTEILENYI